MLRAFIKGGVPQWRGGARKGAPKDPPNVKWDPPHPKWTLPWKWDPPPHMEMGTL